MQNVIINVNGQIVPSGETRKPWISVFDRAYLYGDSLYEVIRTYQGRFFGLDEHLERLRKSAELCRMVLAQPLSLFRQEIMRSLQAFKELHSQAASAPDAYCRIIVSRGEGKIGFGLSCLTSSSRFVIIVQPIEKIADEQLHKGAKLRVVDRLRNDSRALDPAMKSGNYLNSLLSYLEATNEGYDDALMCNAQGHLTEGTTFNIFYIRNGIIATPPLDIGILDGISRRLLIDLAKQQNLPLRTVRFPKERLYEADEVFLTSSTKEAFPVTRVDSHTIGNGKPGPITLRLRGQFEAFALSHPSSQFENPRETL